MHRSKKNRCLVFSLSSAASTNTGEDSLLSTPGSSEESSVFSEESLGRNLQKRELIDWFRQESEECRLISGSQEQGSVENKLPVSFISSSAPAITPELSEQSSTFSEESFYPISVTLKNKSLIEVIDSEIIGPFRTAQESSQKSLKVSELNHFSSMKMESPAYTSSHKNCILSPGYSPISPGHSLISPSQSPISQRKSPKSPSQSFDCYSQGTKQSIKVFQETCLFGSESSNSKDQISDATNLNVGQQSLGQKIKTQLTKKDPDILFKFSKSVKDFLFRK